MAMNITAKNSMLDHLTTEILYISLHSGYPATIGAGGNEITGGLPAYIRKAITWGTAANGVISATNQPQFNVPPCVIASVGFCSAETDGVIYGDYDVANEVYAAQGIYNVTSCSIDLNK